MELCASIFGSAGTLGLASTPVGGNLGEDEPASQPYDSSGDDWDSADMPVESLVDGRAGLLQDSHAICELDRSAIVTVPEDDSSVFSLNGQNQTLSRSRNM